jgi:hypothetical protein
MPGPVVRLPYPRQLPQDYYTKNLPSSDGSVPVPVSPDTGDDSSNIIDSGYVNNGGVYYGNAPPDNPLYGWLWTNTQGALYVYMEPGVWSQIGTNW